MAFYDVNAAIEKPNMLAGFRQGQQYGMQLRQQRQANADNAMLRGLAPQVVAGDPAAFEQASAIDPKAAAAYQGAGDSQMLRLKGAIDFIEKAKSVGNPQAVEAAYQQVRPYLARFGREPPATFAEAEPQFEQAKARIAMAQAGNSGDELKSLRIGGNGNYWAIQGGRFIDTGIQADPRTQLRDQPGMAPGIVNLRTGAVSPLQGGAAAPSAAPTRADMEADIGLANEMVAAGIPAEQVDAFLKSRGQRAQAAPPAMAPGAGLAAPRPSEAQTAAQVEAAKQAVQMQFLPQQQAIETQGAIERARGTEQAKADVERQTGEPARQEKVRQALAKTANITRTIDDAMTRVGAMTAGFLGSMTDQVPGTPANDLRVTVNTIKANLAFDALQAMREASPTGGALGAVSERELALLESAVASLDQSQSPEQLRQALARVKQHYGAWSQAVQQADQEARARAQGNGLPPRIDYVNGGSAGPSGAADPLGIL